MWEEVKITFPDFFDFLRERNKKIEIERQLIIIDNKKIGDDNFYQVTSKFPSVLLVGHVLFADPPASRSNVYVPYEKLQEIEMVFGIKEEELCEYVVSREAES